MKEFEANYGRWVLKYRWFIIIASVLLTFFAASGTQHLKFTSDYRIFFSADNPELIAFDQLENTYTKSDNILFVLTPKDGHVFTAATLQAVELLTEKSWQMPYSIRVDSITNFQYTSAEEDDLVVENLVLDARTLTSEQLEIIRQRALTEPLLVNRLISPDGSVTGVNVTIQTPTIDTAKAGPKAVFFARKIAAEIREAYPDIEVRITGMVMLDYAFTEASMLDMQTLVPLSFAVMLISLGLLIRGFTGTFVTIGVISFSIAAAMGIGGYLGLPLSPPSISSITIILTIAIANSVHILVTILDQMRKGIAKHEAIIESLRINFQPVSIASVTTTIGFLTMLFSDVPPFQHLGIFVALGILTSWLLSLTFLPALMSLLPVKVKVMTSENKRDYTVVLGLFIINHHQKLFWGMLVFIIALISLLPRNEMNDIFIHYFDESVEFRADTDYTTKHLAGTDIMDYSLDSGKAGGISDPQFLKEVEAFADWYQAQPETLHVSTLTDIMKRLNKNMHGDDDSWYKIPDNRELAAQYLLLYEMSLPYGLDLNNQINLDKSATRFTATTRTLSSKEIIALKDRADIWLAENAPNIINAKASGPSLMFAEIGQRNILSMLLGTTIALILISILLIFAFKSLKIGLVSMIPNLIPAAMGFGLWGLLVGEVGLALSVVTGMTLGIVVDDTVHLLSKYLRGTRQKKRLSMPYQP